jgi:putative hydrolase of the HAD superfamily
MYPAPKALSLDLDDTLWPIWPVIERAEAALAAFLRERCPRTADKYPIARMRELREQIAADHPQFAHDFTHQRKLSLRHALLSSGDDAGHAEDAFSAFYNARNRIDFYPDALAALDRLAADDSLPPGARFEAFAHLDRLFGFDLASEVGKSR